MIWSRSVATEARRFSRSNRFILSLPVAYSRFGRLVVPTFQLLEVRIRLNSFPQISNGRVF